MSRVGPSSMRMEGYLGMGSVPRNVAPAMALPVTGQCRTVTRFHTRQEPWDPGRESVASPRTGGSWASPAVRPPVFLHAQQHSVSWVSFSWGQNEMPMTPHYAVGEMFGAPGRSASTQPSPRVTAALCALGETGTGEQSPATSSLGQPGHQLRDPLFLGCRV